MQPNLVYMRLRFNPSPCLTFPSSRFRNPASGHRPRRTKLFMKSGKDAVNYLIIDKLKNYFLRLYKKPVLLGRFFSSDSPQCGGSNICFHLLWNLQGETDVEEFERNGAYH